MCCQIASIYADIFRWTSSKLLVWSLYSTETRETCGQHPIWWNRLAAEPTGSCSYPNYPSIRYTTYLCRVTGRTAANHSWRSGEGQACDFLYITLFSAIPPLAVIISDTLPVYVQTKKKLERQRSGWISMSRFTAACRLAARLVRCVCMSKRQEELFPSTVQEILITAALELPILREIKKKRWCSDKGIWHYVSLILNLCWENTKELSSLIAQMS